MHFDSCLEELGVRCLDIFVLDLGLSSTLLADPERGFSYSIDGPLDMRFHSEGKLKAYDVVNHYSPDDLQRVIREYGEEPFANRIAWRISRERPVDGTRRLREIVEGCIPKGRRAEPHLSRVWQAIRIEVNSELEILSKTLDKVPFFLSGGGRMLILSFHSLEDRIVKWTLKSFQKRVPPNLARTRGIPEGEFHLENLTRRPVTPGSEERSMNPRSRSAKLRAAKKIMGGAGDGEIGPLSSRR